MRPSSAYGRGNKITAATQENFYNNSKQTKQQKGNNPILAGKGILSDEQIEYQLNSCKQNDIELLRAHMNLKIDITQKRQDENKKIIVNGYEEQCKLLNEMNEKKMETLKQEHEKFIEKLLNKQKQEIKELEQSNETKIKALKNQLEESQREFIRKQEEMLDQFQKDREKLEAKHSKKTEDLKLKQKNKYNEKIEKLKQEFAEEQEEEKHKIKKDCEKKVLSELKEMKDTIELLNKQIEEQKAQLIQKNIETSDLLLELKDLKESNGQLQKLLTAANQNTIQNAQQQSQQKQKQQQNPQQIKQKCSLIEEQNEDGNNTDYESLESEREGDQIQKNKMEKNNEDFMQQLQQDVSLPYKVIQEQQNNDNNFTATIENNEEQEFMDLQQLQSDIKQSIQYQINLLHSKSQSNSNSNQMSYSLTETGNNTLQGNNNNNLNSELGKIFKIDKNESIKIQSKEIFQKTAALSDKLDHLENLSLNNSQDYVMEGEGQSDDNINKDITSDLDQRKGTKDQCSNTSFKLLEDLAKKDNMIKQMQYNITQQQSIIQQKQLQLDSITSQMEADFKQRLSNYALVIQEKTKRQSVIMKNYQSEIQKLMARVSSITDIINEAQVLPSLQINSSSKEIPPIAQQLSQQSQTSAGGKIKSGDIKSDQKKNEQKSPAFVIHSKQNTLSQKANIIVRSSLKQNNALESRSTQQQLQQQPTKANKI